MFFHITNDGAILAIFSRTDSDEVLLHCARIGYNP